MEPKKRAFFLLFFVLVGIASMPLFCVHIPPLVDYPNHLARMHILSHWEEDPWLQEYYDVQWSVLPNLAMDLIVPTLHQKMPLEWAGKAFIIITFFLLMGGVSFLNYALFGKMSYWPLISVLFLYNRSFLWGFLNFLFGLGLAVWVYGFWVHFKNKNNLFRLFIFSLLSVCIFFSHLFALGVYGLCILGDLVDEQMKRKRQVVWREWAVSLTQFAVPALLLIFFSPTATKVTVSAVKYGSVMRKMAAIFRPVNTYHFGIDLFTFLLLWGFFFYGLKTRKILFSPKIFFPISLLSLFFVLMPEKLFTVHGADVRMPIALAFLLVGGTALHAASVTQKPGLCILILMMILRIGVIWANWNSAEKVYAEYRESFELLPPGSKLASVISLPGPWHPLPIPIKHIPCLSVVQRSAFVSSIFAFDSQQPIKISSDYKILAEKTPDPLSYGLHPDWRFLEDHYPFLLVVNEARLRDVIPDSYFEIYRGKNFRMLERIFAEFPGEIRGGK